MPKPSDYTPARKHIMQAIMLAVLGLAIALAALLTLLRSRIHAVPLSTHEFSAGDVTVRLPAGWRVRLGDPTDPRIIAQASSAPAQAVRSVWVFRQTLDVPISPLQYLAEAFGVFASENSPRTQTQIRSTIPLGPDSAVLVAREHLAGKRGNADLRKDLYAVAVLPSLEALVVRLTGTGTVDADDEALVKEIAAAILVGGTVAAQPTDSAVTLPEGIRIDAPPGFAAVSQPDPNRTDRLFWPLTKPRGNEPSERDWTAIELVGCQFPALSAHDSSQQALAASELTTLLLVRDPRWRNADVTPDATGWRAELNEAAAPDAFPERAQLLTSPGGRSVLIILHGGQGHEPFDSLWQQLSKSVKFLPASDSSQLLDAGAAEAARLRRDEFAGAIKHRDDRWFLWTDGSDHPYRGWSHVDFDPHAASAQIETRRFNDDGTLRRIAKTWALAPDAQNFSADTTLATLQPSGQEIDAIHEKMALRNGLWSMSLTATDIADKAAFPAPAQYVPGPLLELLMNSLSDGPMLLRTDSFLNFQAVGAPRLLGVIIRPGENLSRIADGEGRPMRCVTAEVNGSGRISRWYFRAAGDLESIELPAGVNIAPGEETPIRVDFKGTAMAP